MLHEKAVKKKKLLPSNTKIKKKGQIMFMQSKTSSDSIRKFISTASNIFMKNFLLCLSCTIIIFCITDCSNEETISEYSSRMEKKLNKDLADPNNAVRRRVQAAHGTVDVTSAYISKIRVVTKDGSNNAGENGSNVSGIQVNIMTRWDGIFHKDGFTEFYVDWDMASGEPKVKKAGIVKTNAVINAEDPQFWITVAGLILLI